MAINFTPKPSQILRCNFGLFLNENGDAVTLGDAGAPIDKRNFNGRIPPEMIKQRFVVVLNGKLGNSSLVVPISTVKDIGSINQGYHIPFPHTSLERSVHEEVERWAKGNLIQMVSNDRLFGIKDKNGAFIQCFAERQLVTEIQTAVIKAINAKSLLK